MIYKRMCQIVGQEQETLNAELKQYFQMYKMFNAKGHLGTSL